jgi:hypothetical protein
MHGENIIRKLQQVTTDGDSQIYNPLDVLSKDPKSPWFDVVHMLCTCHLVVQKFDNAVLNKTDREGICYQIKNWIRSYTNYFLLCLQLLVPCPMSRRRCRSQYHFQIRVSTAAPHLPSLPPASCPTPRCHFRSQSCRSSGCWCLRWWTWW